MAEFLHEIVRKRTNNNNSHSVLTQAYNDLISEMNANYQSTRIDARAREAIDRYMSTATGCSPRLGMLMEIPMLDINARAGTLSTMFARYRFDSGVQGYRGWVRIN